MVMKISVALATVMASAVITELDGGAGDAALVIYDGAEPVDADTAITTQVELVRFVLPDPSFGAPAPVSGGVLITANAVDEVDALADGVATWFRIYNADGEVAMQGNVTDTTGSGNLKVSSTDVVAGIAVEIVSMTFRQRTV